MVLATDCLLGGSHLALAPRFSSRLVSRRLLPVRASAPSSSSSPAAADSASASSSILDIPPVPEPTSASLVARSRELLTLEGASALAQVNHYNILQVPYGSTTEEIAQAFKERVQEVNSQRKEGNEEATAQQLRVLKDSLEILTTEEERRIYDWALQRYENRNDTYIWPYETDITQRYSSKVDPPVMRSFDEEGERQVGLFFLGWLLLSLIFGATMKSYAPTEHGIYVNESVLFHYSGS